MGDIVMQVQSQLENERSIIALSFELLKVVNSGLPQNFQGNTQEMVMMYISMRAERMNQFSQISDQLIHQMTKFRSFNSAMKDQFEQVNQLSHAEKQLKDSDHKNENINAKQATNPIDHSKIPSGAQLHHEICQQQTIFELQQQQQLQIQLIEKLQQQYKSQSEQILLLQQQQQHQQQFQLFSQQLIQQKQPEIVYQQYSQNQPKIKRKDSNLLNQSGKPKSMFSTILMKHAQDQQIITEEKENDQGIAKNIINQQAAPLKSAEQIGQLGKRERTTNTKKLEDIHVKCDIDEEKNEEEQDEFDEEYSNETEEYSGQETNSQNGVSSRSQNQNSSRLINSNQSTNKRSTSQQNKKIKNCRQYLKDLPVDVQNIIKQAKRSEVANLARKYNINYSVVKYAALKLEEENQQKGDCALKMECP